MKKKNKFAARLNIINLITFLIVVPSLIITLIAVLATRNPINTQSHQLRSMSDFNTGWQIASTGKRTYVTLPQKFNSNEVTITRTIIPEINNNMVLVFRNNHQVIEVSTDDEIIYTSNDHDFILPCITEHYCMVELPVSRNLYHISIKFTNYNHDYCSVPEFKIGSLFAAYTYIASLDIFSIINIIALFIITVILLFFVISTSARHMFDARISSLTIFTLFSTLLIASSSSISELTPLIPEISASITFFTIMIIPIPALHYIWYTTGMKYNIFNVMIIICRINIIFQLIAGIFTDISPSHLLIPTGIIIMFSLIIFIIYLNKMYKEDRSKYNLTIFISVIVLAVTVIFIMIMYLLTNNPLHLLIQIILTLFCIIHFANIVISIRTQTEKARQTEQELTIYTKLSKKDSLTGLNNRYCFDQDINDLTENLNDNADIALIILDLNGLKYTNDSYGHFAGDELICRAASSINTAYEECGTCYRIGGDEFAVIIPDCKEDDDALISKLENVIAEDNKSHSLTLSIAFGISHMIDSEGNRLNILKWKNIADMNMYRNKQEQKSGKNYIETPEVLDIMNCIVTTLEEKDIYTAKHSSRTRLISELLATKLGLSPKTISDTCIAANIHDIGKIAIPDSILNKSSKLTDEEFKIMKDHAALGAKIIDNSNSMKDIAAAIRHHHERFDGKGYPDGLSHKEIPTISRIIAIADSIDAMTSNRVYRKAFDIDYCRSEIKKNLGIMYDPVIGQIALDNWDEIEKIILENK